MGNRVTSLQDIFAWNTYVAISEPGSLVVVRSKKFGHSCYGQSCNGHYYRAAQFLKPNEQGSGYFELYAHLIKNFRPKAM
jgi:hypothetical protein